MEQAIVRCCNNIYTRRRRRRKVSQAENISSSFLPQKSGGHNPNPLENTEIHNPNLKRKEISGGLSIYDDDDHHHHKKQKNSTTRAKSLTVIGGDELPVDIIYNILSRMPLKSLARFQCVSKVWCNYINNPYLEIMYNAKQGAMKDDPTMLIMFQLGKYPHTSALLTMLVTKEEEEKYATSHEELVITTTTTIRPNPPTPYMEFVSKYWTSRFVFEGDIILGSCKGLIFSSQDNHHPPHKTTTIFLVINPLKKECYKLPPIKIWSCTTSLYHEREACGLGYDDSTNTYKIVCVVLRNQDKIWSHDDDDYDVVKEDLCTMVHDVVLGGTANSSSSSSWREIAAVPAYPISGEAVFANGCLHWLVSYDLKYWPYDEAGKVVCFDMKKEEFGLIDPPNTRTTPSDRCKEHLVDLDGQVGLVYNGVWRTCLIEVWLLLNDDDDVDDDDDHHHHHKTTKWRWVLHCRFSKKPPLPVTSLLKVIGYWNKGAGDLLLTDPWRTRLFIYRLKQGVVHEAKFILEGYPARRTDIRLYQPTFSSILRRFSINNR